MKVYVYSEVMSELKVSAKPVLKKVLLQFFDVDLKASKSELIYSINEELGFVYDEKDFSLSSKLNNDIMNFLAFEKKIV